MTSAQTGLVFLLLSLSLAACSGSNDEHTAPVSDSTTLDSVTGTNAENVFYYIPSPIEMADLLRRAGATYDKSMLNAPENASRYSSSSAQALNLGVYGADLSFAGIFGKNAEALAYMSCANKMAVGLHISAAFNEQTHNRLESNMSNRDSILTIITDAYWDCDALLQENKQPHASALMIAGGWIEGLYLACRVAETTNNNEVRVRIAEQRFSLDKLIGLLETQQNADVMAVVVELKKLQVIYAQLPPPAETDSHEEGGVVVIGSDDDAKPASLNALEFKKIADTIKEIRERVIERS